MALNSEVHIETLLKNGRTILKKSFCNPPFKIADVTEDRSQPVLQLMLMSSSPGVLDGDEYNFEIDIAGGSSLELSTQSYQRLFQMKTGATQFMNINLGEGASFSYVPHPLVPHENSIFLAKNKIHLSGKCSLIWGEVMNCGRKLNGEVFRFSSYHSITEIFKNNKLVAKENLLVRPAIINPASIGQLEGYTHQATLIYINEQTVVTELTEKLVEDLNREKDIAFGVSKLPVNGLIVRLLGFKAEQLFDLLKQTANDCSLLKQHQNVKPAIHVI